jgi:CheY-like chemotaxis protein
MILGERLHAARIAVVDDEPANVRVLERFLGLAGFRDVRTWTYPREALEALEHEGADLLLLDLLIPGLDGYSILDRLRGGNAEGPRMPVIVLTADATRGARERALGLGATDFLTKPFDPTEIGLRIRNILVTHFLEQDLLLEKASLEGQVWERRPRSGRADRQRVLGEQRSALRRLVTAQGRAPPIAADIHDDTIQTMAALAIRLACPPEGRDVAAVGRAHLAVETARRPRGAARFPVWPTPFLDRDGLVAALRRSWTSLSPTTRRVLPSSSACSTPSCRSNPARLPHRPEAS